MTQDERTQLDTLCRNFETFCRTQETFNARVIDELGSISRGLYGDEKNNQIGLVHRQREDERQFIALTARIHKVENQQYKTGVWLGVGVAAFTLLSEFIKTLWPWK